MRRDRQGGGPVRRAHRPAGDGGSYKDHARFKEAGADPGGGNGCGLFGSFNGPVHAGNGTHYHHRKYEKRIPIARENFKRAGWRKRSTLLEGDAGEILGSLSGSFDFIFMDAAKGQYVHWLPDALRLLAPGGLLMSDNVLQDGTIVESRYAVERRDRTIHVRMREYLYT